MVAYLLRMPAGIAGQVNRLQNATIEPQGYDPNFPFPAYGVPAKVGTSGLMQPITTGDVSSVIYGMLVRPYPTTGAPASGYAAALGAAVPPGSGICNIMRRGYMMVALSGVAVAVKDGPAYSRVANVVAGKALGDVEAGLDISVVGVAGANTGNGTIGSLSALPSTPVGVYVATMTSATKFQVTDVSGAVLGAGTAGAQLTLDDGLSMKITAGGTAFAANDSFTITVSANNVVIPNAYFTGAADANGFTELAFNI